ncbi:MAG: DEAD/DEAH box helicase [Limnochordaceae bacterium]|nr:DEAD/DEAH box helicase [Limnochordaceae bacterium]
MADMDEHRLTIPLGELGKIRTSGDTPANSSAGGPDEQEEPTEGSAGDTAIAPPQHSAGVALPQRSSGSLAGLASGVSAKKSSQRPFAALVREYHGLSLDPFQSEAIMYLNQQTSTLVCAPTGTGKTLIADYLVDTALKVNQRINYTGPVKALVNQKYREFARHFGAHRVGILTGDVSSNSGAPLLLMTTEVLRNMLLYTDDIAASPWATPPGEPLALTASPLPAAQSPIPPSGMPQSPIPPSGMPHSPAAPSTAQSPAAPGTAQSCVTPSGMPQSSATPPGTPQPPATPSGTARSPAIPSPGPSVLAGVSWVIFDEIHYLDHPERGTVWEEAILLLPPGVHLLGLSATIANAAQLAAWITQATGEPCALVQSHKRSVPLVHRFFNERSGVQDASGLLASFTHWAYPDRDDLELKGRTLDWQELGSRLAALALGGRFNRSLRTRTTHLQLVQYAQDELLFPTLYFVFSRRSCEQYASQLARHHDYLRRAQKETVRITVEQTLKQLGLVAAQIPDLPKLMQLWQRGIAYHHAGLLPAVKRIVESLLERRVLRVLYATETFAVGVNMPVRAVCFDTLEKHAGAHLRPLTRQEYLQMAGRAGRRGIDRVGMVISRIEFHDLQRWLATNRWPELPIAIDWEKVQAEPIVSHLHLSYNFVLNLTWQRGVAQAEEVLRRSLRAYQGEDKNTSQSQKQAASRLSSAHQGEDKNTSQSRPTLVLEENPSPLLVEYHQRLATLTQLEYIEPIASTPGATVRPYCGFRLLPRGQICRRLYVHELLVTELLYEGVPQRLTPAQLAGLAGAIVGDEALETGVRWPLPTRPPAWWKEAAAVADRLRRRWERAGYSDKEHGRELRLSMAAAEPLEEWAAGISLGELLERHPLEPGDLVTVCRQAIDLLRQMSQALPTDGQLQQNVRAAVAGLDRDVVQARL